MVETFDHLKAALADHYVLERELGSGGMATVFLAHDPCHNRKVAIKVMRPEIATVIGSGRFLKEIETTANLQHLTSCPCSIPAGSTARCFTSCPTSRAKSPPRLTTPIGKA